MSARAVSALAEFEARQAAQSQPPPTDTLPVSQSSFVGRTRELAELSALLGSSRLITLIGPGGAGKTRLAIEAIHRHPPAKEVVFIPLERLRALESLVAAVAFALRVRDQRQVSNGKGKGAILCQWQLAVRKGRWRTSTSPR